MSFSIHRPRPIAGAPPPRPRTPPSRYALSTGSPAEVRLVVDRLWSAHGRGQRLRRMLAAACPPSIAARLAPVRPAGEQELERLRQALALVEHPDADHGPWVLIADVHDRERDRLAAVRVDGRGEPREVIKAAAAETGRSRLRREADALTRCRQVLAGSLAGSIPRLLGVADSSRLTAVWLTACEGRTQYVDLHADLRPWRWYRDHLQAAGTWLAAFHGATRHGERDGVPVAASHGDFWAGNVLRRDAGGVAVIDWESFDPATPVTEDVLGYLVSYALGAPGPGYRKLPLGAALRRGLLQDGPLAAAVTGFLGAYCRGMGIDRRALDGPLLEYLQHRVAAASGARPAAAAPLRAGVVAPGGGGS